MPNIKMPDYDHCILNTISSILKYYNVKTEHKTLKCLDEKLQKEYKNIVLLILDGMGEHILNRLSPNGFFYNKKVDCVTSVFPSTTTAALTTYYSGKPPYETGWIAWSQYFKEYGRALDMLSHKESYLGEYLKSPTIDVFEEIVNYETVFEQIEKASIDVKAYEVMPKYSERRSKRTLVADNIDEIIENIELLCENPGKKFIMAYSDKPDATLHKFGAYSDEAKDFIIEAETKVEKMCKNLDEDTLLIISADHGHRDIEKAYSMTNPTVTGILQNLEKNNWIERIENPNDARSKVIKLTKKALKQKEELYNLGDNLEKEFTKGLNKTEQNRLNELLNKLFYSIKEV